MQYYSTNHVSPPADFKEAVINGLPPDGGLYFPEEIPSLPEDFINNLEQYSTEELAYEVLSPYVKGIIPVSELVAIIIEAIDYKIPLVKINKDISSLELFHGPTLTTKDLGARFAGRCLEYFSTQMYDKPIVLVATSGDEGSAIANSLFDTEGIDVVILYPEGKLNIIQEKQLTTLGKNIHPIEVKGTYEDCKKMVNEVFADKELQEKIFLTAPGSANIAVWLSQQLYYFFAYKQWIEKDMSPVIAVPSGDLSNISSGLLAYRSGLPVQHFIAACNSNGITADFLKTEKYQPKKTIATISSAIDVGDPADIIRIMELFDHNVSNIKKVLSSYSINDSETKNTIRSVYYKTGNLLDPHGAVGYTALSKYLTEHPDQKGIVFKTAHPAKFFDIVEPIIEEPTPMPASVELELIKEKTTYKIDVDVNILKYYLLTLS